jgi:RPA family protein
MVEDKQNQERQIAFKVTIKEILNGNYIKKEGWNPNYLVLKDGREISRVNIVGIVTNKPESNEPNSSGLLIDDGTGKINIRSFENCDFFKEINVGDFILLIGKLREFGNERYITPEIIKKIENKGWINLRKMELKKIEKEHSNVSNNENNFKEKNEKQEFVEEEIISDEKDINSIIKSLDKGEGVDFNEILEKLNIKNAEDVINDMIKRGELFEIKPGKIKVLE